MAGQHVRDKMAAISRTNNIGVITFVQSTMIILFREQNVQNLIFGMRDYYYRGIRDRQIKLSSAYLYNLYVIYL